MIMINAVIIVAPNTTIERTALIMEESKINALLVMEDERVVGNMRSSAEMEYLPLELCFNSNKCISIPRLQCRKLARLSTIYQREVRI